MPGSFLENDLTALLNTGDFAVAGVLTPASGPVCQITGIFDDEDVEVERDDGRRVLQKAVRFMCKSSVDAAVGDTLEVGHASGNVTYTVRVVQDDGTGMTTLWLEKV